MSGRLTPRWERMRGSSDLAAPGPATTGIGNRQEENYIIDVNHSVKR